MATPDRDRAVSGDFSLYIIRCADGSLYTGISTDVARRILEHENGKRGARYLRGRGPLKLEYAEAVGNRSAASRAEYIVKQLDAKSKEELISRRRLLTDLL